MLGPLMRVKHSLDYEPSTYGNGGSPCGPYKGRQHEQKEGREVRMLKTRAGMPVLGSIQVYGE